MDKIYILTSGEFQQINPKNWRKYYKKRERLYYEIHVASNVGAEVTLVINEDRANPLEIRDLIEYTNAPIPPIPNDTQNWTSNDWRHGSGDSSGYIPGSMPPGYFAWLRSQPGYGNRVVPWKIQYVEVGNEVFAPYCPKQNPTSECHKIPGQCEKCENQVENGCPSPPGIGRRYDTLNRDCSNPGDPKQRTGVYQYIDRLTLFIKAIHAVDPTIKISAVGLNGSPTCQWNKVLVNSLTETLSEPVKCKWILVVSSINNLFSKRLKLSFP